MSNLENLIQEIKIDLSRLRYHIYENELGNKTLNILGKTIDDECVINSFDLSKDQKSLVLKNGNLSIDGDWMIGFKSTIEKPEYIKISLNSTLSIKLISYDNYNDIFTTNLDDIMPYLDKLIKQLTKIFHDVSGSYSYPKVKATKEDIKLFKLL